MQFQLSGLTTNTTRTLSVPDYSCYVLGTSNIGGTGTTNYVPVCSGVATTSPSWTQLDHTVHLSNKGTNTHAQDALI